MAKGNIKKEIKHRAPIPDKAILSEEKVDFFSKKNIFLFLIILIGFVVYSNTVFNEYAYDDGMAITDNAFTQKGFSGIKDILINDTFIGVKGAAGELTGGRYRPLSVITFAIEKGIFGKRPWVGHLINILLYCCLLYYLFQVTYKYIFKESELKAFFTMLIFTIHPIHTEVIANLKSRDEILSFLFLFIALFYFLKSLHKEKIHPKYTIIACLSYFLALMSKENGITFLAIFPLTFYVAKKGTVLQSIKSVLPYLFVAGLYLLIRYSVVGLSFSKSHELMNAPFLLASGVQAFATKAYILSKYLFLLFIPYPLSYDYSFNQIPYLDAGDLRSWLSILLYMGLLIYSIFNLRKRSIISYALLFYLITISIVSNFIFEVGATMGERFLFQPSYAFALMAGIFLHNMYMKMNEKIRKFIFLPLLSIIVISASTYSMTRNRVWKNDYTLFMNDIHSSPKSAKVYVYAGVVLVKSVDNETDSLKKQKVLRNAINIFEKGLKIYPDFTDAYLNMGVAYSNLNEKEKALECWEKANEISPGHFIAVANLQYLSDWYLKKAIASFNEKDFDGAIKYTEISVRCNKKNALSWYNLGGYWMMKGDKIKAKEFWKKTLEVDPNYTEAKGWLMKLETEGGK